MQGSDSTVNPQQSSTGLQPAPTESVQGSASTAAPQAGNEATAALQSPATNQQAQQFLAGETAGQRVSGNGDDQFMSPAVSAVLMVLALVVLVLAVLVLVQRLKQRHV